MTRSFKLLSLSTVICALSACTTTPTAAPSPTFGKAVKHNIAAQAVIPSDAQKQNTFIPADRARQDLARDRYRKDEVETPVSVNTRQ